MSAIQDIDKGWNRIQKELKLLDNSFTKVGLPEEATPADRTISDLVLIGVVNEFGSKVNNIPSRPAFRRAFDKNRKKINDLKAVILGKLYTGDVSARQALGLVGEFLTNATKKEITDLKSPPNAPSTIKRKGSSNPLIDTGQMRASVTHVEVMG